MDTIWLIIDSSGIDYVAENDEVMGAYTSQELAEKALAEYEKSKCYKDIDRCHDWHTTSILDFELNKNVWEYDE